MRLNIKGIPVKLSVRTQTGVDGFNRPIYETSQEVVENVLVGEPSAEDVVNEINLSGKRIAYVLATQGIDDNIPLEWNKKVKVERYE